MNIKELSIATIRGLAVDSVENAKNGHMGMPLGAATVGYSLFHDHMIFNPKNPKWLNRDRFVLTSGHGSILLYSLLHLSGYNVKIDDLKQFRQLGSITPGHPEFGVTEGVEATTGPLGQGFSMVVGLAIGEAHLAERFNKPNFNIIDHYTYTICGDGDLEEGVALEAAAIAGNLGLGKLIVLYDANQITSDGPLELSSQENIVEKFKAMNWQVLVVEDGNDIVSINNAIDIAKTDVDRPTLIKVHTTIGFGSSLQGTHKIHSNPVGDKEAAIIKKNIGFEYENFEVPEEVYSHFKEKELLGQEAEIEWKNKLNKYKENYTQEYSDLVKIISGDSKIDTSTVVFKGTALATRDASGISLNTYYKQYPALVGGSADLASSNKTTINDFPYMSHETHSGPNIHFGVREFAMASIVNGLTLYGLRGYCGTFLVFSDYMRSAIRHAALMKVPSIFIMTHDSMYVGQDGPTHQPIEHLISLRAMPNLVVYRPADANETKVAWKLALESKETPYLISLGRHNVPVLAQVDEELAAKGGYILEKTSDVPDLVIVATGSEVATALEVSKQLDGYNVNVVSLPSWELFEKQSKEYQDTVLPPTVSKRVSIELGSTLGWDKYVGSKGLTIGVNQFGESAPADALLQSLGFTVDEIATRIKKYLSE
ncbi:transketolase [Streptococcus sp. A22]|uniref:transketolase n=1 Tax=Streptococcus sp. A22 TaxID=3373126 RepID=UPI00374D0408